MKLKRDIAAGMLSSAMCDALCPLDVKAHNSAKDWLLLDRTPTLNELLDPLPYSFLACCQALGARWFEIKCTVRAANIIDEADDHRLDALTYLHLVPSTELEVE